MKLKNIIKEAKNEKLKAQNLERLLNSTFKNDISPGGIIYRGYKDSINTFEVKKIRSDRSPMDTPLYLQNLVDLMAEEKSREFPKRSESKFATQSKSFASRFGEVFYCFPQKNSNIVSRKNDSWDEALVLVDDNMSSLRRVYEKVDDKGDLNVSFKKVVENLIKAKASFEGGKVRNYVENAYKFWKKYRTEIKNYAYENGFDELPDMFDLIETHYFGEFFQGIPSRMNTFNEVMFDGDHYLLVDLSFFNKYFRWNKSGYWELKYKYTS